MKRYIFTAALAAACALPGLSDGYDLVVTTADGESHKFDSSKVEKVLFNNNLQDYSELISAGYATSSSLGSYTVTIGTSSPDNAGDPANVGDVQIAFTLTGEAATDPQNASLPAGNYQLGNGKEPFTFDLQKSAVYLRSSEGSNGVETMPIIAGNVEVFNAGGLYVLTGSVVTLQGFSTDFIYNGPISFQPSLGSSSPFDNDLNIDFEGAQMRFYGNWFDPFSDDVTVQLYTGSFNADGAQTEGYWFNVDLHMPKVADPWSKDIVLADGVYNVEWRERPENNTYLPFTYMPGVVQDVFGIEMPSYTYISHKAASGVTNLGVVRDGTITISGNGSVLEFDLVMGNGKKLTGKYTGSVLVGNFHDADMPDNIELLDSNVELDFTPKSLCISYNDGPTILKGINTFLVMIADSSMKEGDYLSLYLLTDKDELADGTYNIGKLENFGGVKGSTSYGGDILYSWYSDLSTTDDEGYQSVIAPIEKGTVKVTTIDDSTRKFEMDLTTLGGKKVTGSFEGLYIDATDFDDTESANLPSDSRKNAPAKVALKK